MQRNTDFFMGANTPEGFFSLFDELYDPYSGIRCYIIKGGPGTGKSTLMKRVAAVAARRGMTYECIHCASDPASLDAVILPQLGVCFVDGTAPHVIEPKFPGVCEQIINLGDHWDADRLAENAGIIRLYTQKCSELHARSIRYIRAAGALRADTARVCAPYVNAEKVITYADRFVARELKRVGERGELSRRFLSAVTPQGCYAFGTTVQNLCGYVIGIEDETRAVSGILLERLAEKACERGYDVIACPCPLNPRGEPEHLIIPRASVAFVTVRRAHEMLPDTDRLLHASRFIDTAGLAAHRRRLAFNEKTGSELVEEAALLMRQAGGVHDSLERLYSCAMDFAAVRERCGELIKLLDM